MATDPGAGPGGARPATRGRPSSGDDGPLTLLLAGGFTLLDGTRTVPLKSRKGAALFAYLALTAPRGQTREHLAGLLWSESEEALARASLRQTLKAMREDFRNIGFQGLKSDRVSVALEDSSFEIDLLNALEAIKQGHVDDLLLETERAAESLLAGFEDLDPSFRAWLSVQRQNFHDSFVGSLEATLEENVDVASGSTRDLASALTNLEPSNETACRALMRHYAQTGDIASALRRYNELWDLLDRDYDMEPSQETQDLAVAIKSGETPARKLVAPSAEPPKQLPATIMAERRVLLRMGAFDMQGAAPERHYQIQGFRFDLIASLVRFREWAVVEGDDPELATPDVRPHDQYLIEATAFEDVSMVRLVLTLRDLSIGQYIWSDRFDLNVEHWFEIQQVVVRRIAVALNVHLSAERLARCAQDPDVPAHLYDRWLLGQELSFRWRPQDETRAEQLFRGIIEEAPEFAPAYSSLVQITNVRHLVFPGIFRSPDREEEALSMAKTLVQLDPLDSRTHLCLGWSNAMNGQFNHAEISYRLAFDLNENDPWTLVSCSLGFAFCGELGKAKALADQALDLGMGASRVHWGYQVCVRFLEGDYERCIEAADRAEDRMFGLPAWKSAALYHLGRHDEAALEAKRFLALVRSRWKGELNADEETIMRWVLHGYPIRRRQDWERLRDGLRGAGAQLPPDIRHSTRAK